MRFAPGFHILTGRLARDLPYELEKKEYAGILYLISGQVELPNFGTLIATGLDVLIQLVEEKEVVKLADILYTAFQGLSATIINRGVALLLIAPSGVIEWVPVPTLRILDYDKTLLLARTFRKQPQKIGENHLYVQPPV
jgi:hypothetical protein